MTSGNDNERPDGVLRFLRSLDRDRSPADLEPAERGLLEQAIRDAAAAGAQAWARVDQVQILLSSIDGGAS